MSVQKVWPASTIVKGSGTRSLAPGAREYFPGRSRGLARRQFIVTNLSSTDVLEILGQGGDECATVFPRTLVTWETDDDLILRNPGASPVSYQVAEVILMSAEQLEEDRRRTPGTPARAGSSGGGGGGSSGGSGAGGGSGFSRL